MNHQQNQNNPSKTDVEKVKKQNEAAEKGKSNQTEFASETDAQKVKKQNQQASRKGQ
ncbi:gamma-type small acid-soluble spore protein [Salicibibacter cibarius]|uniref:Small, acid-soluble spore protein gamma-type n=1 Tax=Salicibibacter cibarius TaxID=2743000 RepID=A0A7T6Z3E4_9BACI|nr:gamma-type small acid-soluble spore protein [Salicibibacter cibarius]QQK76275.1 gamma-type small acid-soluble spore protein [Salicibibacter cibarius]